MTQYNLPPIRDWPTPQTAIIDIYRYFFWGNKLSQTNLTVNIQRPDIKTTYTKIDLTQAPWKYE